MSGPDHPAQQRRVRQREKAGSGLPDISPVTAWEIILAMLSGSPGDPVAFPPHVHAYLEQVAWRITTLANGRDYQRVARNEGVTARGLTLVPRSLSFGDATARLPAALGLSKPRWNAIRAHSSDREAWSVMVQHALAQAGGLPPREARRFALKISGINVSGRQGEADAMRSLRRIMARGKRPLR